MATYTIVSSSKDPLGPGEINAASTITVAEGDIFIIGPDADANVVFEDGGAGPVNFDVQFNDSNANTFYLVFKSGVTPTVDIADNVDMASVSLDANDAVSLTVNAGNEVSIGAIKGSEGSDTITAGDGLTATEDWLLLSGDDVLTVGDNADFTYSNIKAGLGNDSLTFGSNTTFAEIDGEDGADTISFGNSINGTKIVGGGGDDVIWVGTNATIGGLIDGGANNDTLNTATTGLTQSNIETTNVVCFAAGTLIDTAEGLCAVEDLQIGDDVRTLDHGAQTNLWVRSSDHALETEERDAKPVLIAAGALGNGIPAQDLIVSPQHRIFVGGDGQLENWFNSEAFVPAKSLTSLPGIRHMKGKRQITWVHFACRRHEVVSANGCLSESLLLGPMVMNGVSSAERQVLTGIYGFASSPDEALNGSPAREVLTVGAVRRQLEEGRRLATELRKWDLDLAMEHYETERLCGAGSMSKKNA